MRRSARVVPRPAVKAVVGSRDSSPTIKSDQDSEFEDTPAHDSPPPPTKKRPRVTSSATNNSVQAVDPVSSVKGEVATTSTATTNATKKRRVKTTSNHALLHKRLFDESCTRTNSTQDSCSLPDRLHTFTYHRPLLLDSRTGRDSLLIWFDSVSTARSMPWRKAWIDPLAPDLDESTLRDKLERRAYEVWISEIMLQQTRVAVVIDYWNKWMEKWPTIHDLAAADADDVLAAWKGLGYYSRATRIHEAAKLVTKDDELRGLLPATAQELMAKVPGVGRYTGGAISAIVFGRPAPMVDGNVLRVLSRQLGLLGDVKGDKGVIDLLWAAADALVKVVAKDAPINSNDKKGDEETWEVLPSDRPGRWGQALMELGSTICQPKPSCEKCPITDSCRAYAEGQLLATTKSQGAKKQTVVDIEDMCSLCATPDPPLTQESAENGLISNEKGKSGSSIAPDRTPSGKKVGGKKQASLSAFAFTKTKTKDTSPTEPAVQGSKKPDAATFEAIANYAKQFPLKTAKKAVREEETLVCAIRRSDGQYLIQRRPEKGLLAGMWEFPSRLLEPADNNTAKGRKEEARKFVERLTKSKLAGETQKIRYLGELGTIPWLFSHIKLEMHVHLFELDGDASVADEGVQVETVRLRWTDSIDDESMGTGMRKCVAMVQDA